MDKKTLAYVLKKAQTDAWNAHTYQIRKLADSDANLIMGLYAERQKVFDEFAKRIDKLTSE